MALCLSADNFQIFGCTLAILAAHQLIFDLLTFLKGVETGSLHGRNMDKSIRTAGLRLDEAIALDGIEPFHCSGILRLE